MYLLDTNVLSELVKKNPNPHVIAHLRATPIHCLFTSCVCVSELRFGSFVRVDFEKFWARINEEIVSRINIVSLGQKEAVLAGDILAQLRGRGESIGMDHVLVAACALANQLTIVTPHVERYSGIKGLAVENWFNPEGWQSGKR
jgi:predicted nucleic acid-binding protein